MNSFAAILSTLVIFVPVSAGNGVVDAARFRALVIPAGDRPDQAGLSALRTPLGEEPFHTPRNHQVHIQQRVIIRIAPSGQNPRPRKIEQVPSGACVPVESIAGVRPAKGNRLLLFMRDSRVLSAELDHRCHAEDFYPGFYLERNEDGRLCQSRDWLQSRAGANCQITGFSRLIATGSD